MRFCPKCGKKGIDSDFCAECSDEFFGLSNLKSIKMKICVNCRSYCYKNKWIKFGDLSKEIKKIIRDKTNKNLHVEADVDKIELKPGIKKTVDIVINGKYIIPLSLDMTYCNKCSKSGGSYFEAVLQLRNPSTELIGFLENELEKAMKKGFFKTKEVQQKEGADYYISSQRFAQTLGKKISERFKGDLKITARLFSVDRLSSKEVHRVSVLFRQFPYQVGQVVKAKGRFVKIKRLGKKLQGIDTETNKRVGFSYDDVV